jgi:hypothetical protein
MHPVVQKLNALYNFASGSEHWEISKIHDCRVENIQKVSLKEELHLPCRPIIHLAKHINVHLWKQRCVDEI